MIRVVIADDEALVRSGLAAIANSADGIEVVGEAADGVQALDVCRALAPDVALLDIAMPRVTGLEAAQQVKRALPGCGVVIVTTFDRDDYITDALHGGLNGFVLKASSPDELIHSIRTAHGGGTYISPRITARLLAASPLAAAQQQDLADLTPREIQVLALLGSGESNQGIARQLHLSEGTVKVHMKAILRKLDVDNRVRAALIAHRAGLVEESGARSATARPDRALPS